MKRVMIHAYLAGNLGDDLFVVMLCRRYPNIKFHILADESYKQKFQDLKNCRIFSENDFIVKKNKSFSAEARNLPRILETDGPRLQSCHPHRRFFFCPAL